METFVYIFLVVMALGLIKVVFDYLKSILVWLSNLLGVERDAEKEKTNWGRSPIAPPLPNSSYKFNIWTTIRGWVRVIINLCFDRYYIFVPYFVTVLNGMGKDFSRA